MRTERGWGYVRQRGTAAAPRFQASYMHNGRRVYAALLFSDRRKAHRWLREQRSALEHDDHEHGVRHVSRVPDQRDQRQGQSHDRLQAGSGHGARGAGGTHPSSPQHRERASPR